MSALYCDSQQLYHKTNSLHWFWNLTCDVVHCCLLIVYNSSLIMPTTIFYVSRCRRAQEGTTIDFIEHTVFCSILVALSVDCSKYHKHRDMRFDSLLRRGANRITLYRSLRFHERKDGIDDVWIRVLCVIAVQRLLQRLNVRSLFRGTFSLR